MLLLLVAPTDAAKFIALRLEPRIPRLYFFSERRRRGGGGGRGRVNSILKNTQQPLICQTFLTGSCIPAISSDWQ